MVVRCIYWKARNSFPGLTAELTACRYANVDAESNLIKIENEDGKRRATLIQMQPWIIGSRSQTMQYVGFSIPVKKGLKLKVMTGFNVNGENSGFGNANSLMTSGVGSMVNTFVGYIVK